MPMPHLFADGHRLFADGHRHRPRGPRRGRGTARVLLAALVALAAGVPTGAAAATGTATASQAEMSGVLERLAVDPGAVREAASTGSASTGGAAITTWLRTETGRVAVDPVAVRDVPTGATVTVRPVSPGAAASSANGGVRPLALSSVTVRSLPRATAASSGAAHPVTVVLALPRGATADGTTTAALARIVNGGVSAYWSRVSDRRIAFSVARSVSWTRLDASCTDVWSVWDEVRRRSGFVPGPRSHLLVYVPPGAGCPTGLATVGGTVDSGGNVIAGGTTTALLAHELGHNLGLGHSEALSCPGSTDATWTGGGFGSACRVDGYGDWYDVMGISWDELGSLSTAHAHRLGLLPSSAVVTARSPVRVTLRPVATRVGVRSLRIQDPAGATYVVEYRPAIGDDAWLATSADWRRLRPGVLLRRIDPADPTQTLLLDATPTGAVDDVDVVLPQGRAVATASGRVRICVESVTSTAVTVAVTMDGVAPALVLQPRGRLVSGGQVTIGQALAAWGQLAP